MAKGQQHINNDGNITRCRVTTGTCPFEERGHYETREDAESAYAEQQENGGFGSSFRKPRSPKTLGFSLEDGGFYGDVPPRSIQIDALNETAEALIEDGNTQLVAACGTGKSYMGRQLMRRMMDEEDANGVAIVLTSSVKLAKDTAADLKPDGEGNYDRAMGEYDKDYNVQVIEVHNESKDVKTNGAIDAEKIAGQWRNALAENKRVVVVSTYQSAELVQQVQSLIGKQAEADLLMNDEAHNILGQKKSVSSSAEAENSGYRSFANEIPGAIQAKHRLYATATPALADSPDDAESAAQGATREEQIAALKAQTEKMAANGKERLTVYSDDELIVGRVSGAITQQTAISEGYLTRPEYQLRAASVAVTSADSFVDASGQPVIYSKSRGRAAATDGAREPLTAQTYGAVAATLNAMVEDPQADEDGKTKNPVHNALAYTGSISQANAFRDNFKGVARSLGGTMDRADAEAAKDSSDPELRRRARLSLLAEEAEVQAAHSGNSVAEKDAAFRMFKGKDYRGDEGGWSPKKRVLANVDIFSEGVSINEIDTVVVSDTAKTSERAMTQAIGRSLRTMGGNTAKNTGHVIVPQVLDEKGRELNGGLITAASYGATRVERAVSTRKLKGQAVEADTTTRMTRYGARGEVQGSELAATIAQTHVKSADDFVASQAIERAHAALGRQQVAPDKIAEVERYRNASKIEQIEMQRTFIRNQAESTKGTDSSWAVANKALHNVDSNSMNTLRQSGRVVTSALSAGDFTAVPASLTENLTRAGVIRRKSNASKIVESPERLSLLSNSPGPLSVALTADAVREMDPEVHAKLTDGVDPVKARMYHLAGKGNSTDYDRLVSNYSSFVGSGDDSRARVLSIIESPSGAKRNSPAEKFGNTLGAVGRKSQINYAEEARRVKEAEQSAAAASAASGDAAYELDPAMVSKNGRLKAPAQKALAELI